MVRGLENLESIGFDLDGTLYPGTPEIDNRVRTQIAFRLLDKKPGLGNLDFAREFFEERYQKLGSGTKVLSEAGYEDAGRVMDDCLVKADVLDLIKPNPKLAEIVCGIGKKLTIFLLTSSPELLADQKLARIGLKTRLFDYRFYGDNEGVGSKSNGDAFEKVLMETDSPAGNILYIGDRAKTDILPAKALGIKTCSVWREIPQADYHINNINEIEDLVT